MTKPAGLDLGAQCSWSAAAPDIARFGIGRPIRIAPLAEPFGQTHGWIVDFSELPPVVLIARPADMPGALAMASLATDADLCESRRKSVVCCVVVLSNAGGMALRTHEIPILIEPGPMQHIVVADLLVRIEVKPALTAFVRRPAIPRNRQRLQSAIGKLDEVLLERIDTERILDLEGRNLAVRAIGFDQILPFLPEETGLYAEIVETGIGEISQHRIVGRMRHCELMVRALPQLCLGLVAAGAGLAADECRFGPRSRGCFAEVATAQLNEQNCGEHGNRCRRYHRQSRA